MNVVKKGVSFKADLNKYKTYTAERPEYLYRMNR